MIQECNFQYQSRNTSQSSTHKSIHTYINHSTYIQWNLKILPCSISTDLVPTPWPLSTESHTESSQHPPSRLTHVPEQWNQGRRHLVSQTKTLKYKHPPVLRRPPRWDHDSGSNTNVRTTDIEDQQQKKKPIAVALLQNKVSIKTHEGHTNKKKKNPTQRLSAMRRQTNTNTKPTNLNSPHN